MRWLLAVCAALVVAPAASAAVPNPCTLLTNAEATKLLGTRIVARELTGSPVYRLCRWSGKNVALAGSTQHVQRTLMVSVARVTRAQFEENKTKAPKTTGIGGVGEAAYTLSQGGTKYLNVWHRGFTLELVATFVTAPLDVEKQAAAAAVKRL